MQDVKVKFAYKAGFRRLWLVLTIVWLGLTAFLSTRYSNVDYLQLAMVMILPPAGLYLVGAAFVWIIEGFARADR